MNIACIAVHHLVTPVISPMVTIRAFTDPVVVLLSGSESVQVCNVVQDPIIREGGLKSH